jgi:hypothetical protein
MKSGAAALTSSFTRVFSAGRLAVSQLDALLGASDAVFTAAVSAGTLDRPALTSPLGHTHTAACEDADSKPARCGSSFMFVPAISNLR